MVEALGRAEAGDAVDLSRQGTWQPIKPIEAENGARFEKSLLFHRETEEVIGVFYKI